MKYQILFSGEKYEKYFNISPVENLPSTLIVQNKRLKFKHEQERM